ncbi:hypothetical protein NC652_018974 [Populus alba x Populus x berolinensis]|nr:hypothetical protein NC652_018974 [Populus alba x Populus x berolinensis]
MLLFLMFLWRLLVWKRKVVSGRHLWRSCWSESGVGSMCGQLGRKIGETIFCFLLFAFFFLFAFVS